MNTTIILKNKLGGKMLPTASLHVVTLLAHPDWGDALHGSFQKEMPGPLLLRCASLFIHAKICGCHSQCERQINL